MRGLALLTCALVAGCTVGSIGGADGEDPGAGPEVTAEAKAQAGPRPLRRLTRAEYGRAVRDLLGVDAPIARFTPEPSGSSGFATPAAMTDIDARTALEVAETIRAAVDVAKLTGCKTIDRACVEAFVRTFGRRAYRRPLTDEERARHLAFYDQLTGELAHAPEDALRVLVSAMLQTPQFLYHWELGYSQPLREGDAIRLDGYELAARLAFFVTGSTPDDMLLDAAESGAILDDTTLELHAKRLLESAKALDVVDEFHRQWLRLDFLSTVAKDKTTYPTFDGSTVDAMGNEIVSLARDVFTGDGRFATLLTTDKTFVNEKLADIYGISGVTGGAMVPAKLDRAQRPFLLTRAAFLAMGANAYEGDPTKRGKLLREQLLCQRLSAPPPGVPPLPSDPTKTVRERHEAHFRDASCAGCHKLTDLVGFGFEHYDAIGKWREVDRGQPVDDRGTVVNIDGHDVPFTGPTELAKIFAESDEVRRCVATQWTRYAYGREEVPADDVSAKAILSAFRASDHDLRALVVAIVKSRSFRYRAPSPGEVLE